MAIPFIKLTLTEKCIDPEAFRWEQKGTRNHLVLAILTQHQQTYYTDRGNKREKYVTTKINIMYTNGESIFDKRFHKQVQARINSQHRRLQFLLIRHDELFEMLPIQQENATSTTTNYDQNLANMSNDENDRVLECYLDANLCYDTLHEYAEWSYEETLKDMSYYCSMKNLNGENVKQAYLKNSAGQIAKFTFNLQLMGGSDPQASMNFLKEQIWENDPNEIYMGLDMLARKQHPNRIAKKGTEDDQFIHKRNHIFKKKYFKDPRRCSMCNDFIWGVFNSIGYQCENCEKVVHSHCIQKIRSLCENSNVDGTYQLPTGEGKIEIHHNLVLKKNWYQILTCSHTGRQILPLQDYYTCKECGKNFHADIRKEHIPKNCGIDELRMYSCLQMIQDNMTQRNQEVGDISSRNYQKATNIVQKGESLSKNSEINGENIMKDIQNDIYIQQMAAIPENNKTLTKVPELSKKLMRSIKARKKKTAELVAKSQFNDFKIECLIGSGSYGKVLLARYKNTRSENVHNLLAIKLIRKDITINTSDWAASHAEKKCLQFKHPLLVSAVCTFDDPYYLYYVMEFSSGGSLFDFVVSLQSLEEDLVRIIGLEVLLSIRYLNDNKIMYRDLKLDNVIISNHGHIKLCDFGMVKLDVSQANPGLTFCGTPEYIPPEILLRKPYLFPCDVWSWSVMMFEMSEGFTAFGGKTSERLRDNILFKQPRFRIAKRMQPDLKLLLAKCFIKDPDLRVTIPEILSDPWFQISDLGNSNVENSPANKIYQTITKYEDDRKFDDTLFLTDKDFTNICGNPTSYTIPENKEKVLSNFNLGQSWADENVETINEYDNRHFDGFCWTDQRMFEIYNQG